MLIFGLFGLLVALKRAVGLCAVTGFKCKLFLFGNFPYMVDITMILQDDMELI